MPIINRIEVEQILSLRGFPRLASRYSQCEKKHHLHRCPSCGAEKHGISTCGLRGCDNPACGRHRYRYVRKYTERLSAFRGELKFITLTYGDIATADPQTLNKVFSAATKTLRSFGHRGAVMVAEVKRTEKSILYLHIHCLSAGKYIPQKFLSWKWQKLTGRSVVDIRQVSEKGRVAGYIMKYLKKPPELGDSPAYADFIIRFFKRRMVRTFGVFYRLKDSFMKSDVECPYCGDIMRYMGEYDGGSDGMMLPPSVAERVKQWSQWATAALSP